MGARIDRVRLYRTDQGIVVTDTDNNIIYQSVSQEDHTYDKLERNVGWIKLVGHDVEADSKLFEPGTGAILVQTSSEEVGEHGRPLKARKFEGEDGMRIKQEGVPVEIKDVETIDYLKFQLASQRLEKRLVEYEGKVAAIEERFGNYVKELDREYNARKQRLVKKKRDAKKDLGGVPTIDDFI